jgi:hypothetical protein
MPNGKIEPDLRRIKRLRNYVKDDNHTDSSAVARGIFEIAYQLVMLRGDIADMTDADEARYKPTTVRTVSTCATRGSDAYEDPTQPA